MKKTIFKISVLALCASLTFTACKKDKDDDKDGELKLSEKTVEQNKADLQQAGINLSNELKAMQNSKAMDALFQLANLQKNGELKDYALKSTDVDAKLKGYEVPDELSETITEMSGVWEWNATDKDFVKKSDSKDAVTYKFPYDANSSNNNCEVNAKVEYASNVKNMPAKVNCSLKIDGKELMNVSYVGSFTNEGYPTSIVETMKIDDFALSTEYARSNSKLSVSMSFLHGKTTLLNCTNSIEGNLTDENIDKLLADSEGEEEEESEDFDFIASVISKAKISTQVMNFKIVGSIATKSLAELAKKTENKEEIAGKEELEGLVKTANDAIDCYVVNASENTKIASIKLFVVKDDDSYDGAERYDVEPMFVFPDETKMTFDEYFKTGFDEVGNAFEDLFKSFEESLDKYGLTGDDDGRVYDGEEDGEERN